MRPEFRKTMKIFSKPVHVFLIGIIIMLTSCGAEELTEDDFSFEGPLGSDGTTIEKLGTNYFKVKLGHAPEHTDWPNKLNFRILDNAKGNSLRLVVEGPPNYSFNEYFQSWSYDGKNWQPIHWENGHQESPKVDSLIFPTFKQDQVYCGTQVPLSFEQLEGMIKEWRTSPYVKVNTLGKSIHGRNLYRLEITDPESDQPRKERWVHYFANQHPGEHNSQWRMIGMIQWLLSDEATEFRKHSICHFIPMMSPDGPSRGWYRVNAEGVDMNRSYRPEGADSTEQAHEAYISQKDLEQIMQSEAPATTIWSMHTWQGPVEPLLRPGPEIGNEVAEWTRLRDIIRSHDPDTLIEDLDVRTGEPGYGYVSWSAGPHKQFGISSVLCEGAGNIYTKENNIRSGEILIKSLAEYYNGDGNN
ncbi:MAG: M14 family zinc carboxypeptidase [Bacteroidales bacterium]